jgi:pimeloyl-ACP methyl ester carboxylesterase
MVIPSASPKTRTIDLSRSPLTYCDMGDSATSILLLHGLSFRPGLYPLIEHLLPNFRVIALDLPFYNRDHSAADHTHIQSHVNLILEFITTLQLKGCAIFGNSLGGTLGLMCAHEDPTAFSQLILRAPLWTRSQLPTYLRLPHPSPTGIYSPNIRSTPPY